ncbi:DUF456 domain-containing protein [Demetria terragena]|uniref:DUF456 domain-containing protein n=1 Tax=Demetria terragena TaxID=63959 RepID=UPI000361EF2A|nr:DUF456 domain-containing protein [Demetria terragena]
MEIVTVLAVLLVAVGIVGLVIPVLPGLLLTVLGVFVWALERNDSAGWTVWGICVAVAVIGWVLQYAIPGRRLKAAGVPTRTLVGGAILGVIGFFVIPVVGLFVGFVLGIFLMERLRLDTADAWAQTKVALKGVLMSIGIELCAALVVATTFVVGLLATR